MKRILTIVLAIFTSSAFAYQLDEVYLFGYKDVMERQCEQVIELARGSALVAQRGLILEEKRKKGIDVSDEEYNKLTYKIDNELRTQIYGGLYIGENLTNNWVREDQFSALCSVTFSGIR